MANTDGTTGIKHDADQAGGEKEIVYSSDGGDPIKIHFPPKVSKSSVEDILESPSAGGGGGVGSGSIVTEGMNSEQAFEVFAGKIFPTAAGSSKYALLKSSPTTTETPIQRLGRLQQELNELKQYVSTSVSSNDETKEAHDIKVSFEAQIQALQEQWSLLSEAQAKQQEKLTATIDATIDGIQTKGPASSSTVVPAASSTVVPSIEERMKRLELAVGAAASGPGSSIFDRIQKLEKSQTRVDEKQAEQLQKRAKVIRQDLEAAAKARNKLMSGGATGGGGGAADDAKIIAALYDQLQSLSGMTDHLPVLAQRLQNLAAQHMATSTWETRLRATESVVATFETQLNAVEQTVQQFESSLKENAVQMQQNIQALEDRVTKVSQQ